MFSIVGGVPEPDIAGHDDDDVVVGDVIVGNEGVGDDDDEDDDDDRKTQDPVPVENLVQEGLLTYY